MLNKKTEFDTIQLGRSQFMVVRKQLHGQKDMEYGSDNTRTFKTLRRRKPPKVEDWENPSDEEDRKIEEVFETPNRPEKVDSIPFGRPDSIKDLGGGGQQKQQ